MEQNPGPAHYQPKANPRLSNTGLYTFGHRRQTSETDCLKLYRATPQQVGPGRYVPEAAANHSRLKDYPRYSLPKEPRMPANKKQYDKNQSYDVRKHFGKQVASKN